MNAKSYEPPRQKSRGKFSMVKFAQLEKLWQKTLSAASDAFLLKQMEITIDIENQLDAKIDEREYRKNLAIQSRQSLHPADSQYLW